LGLSDDFLALILGENAKNLYSIDRE
jgi:hypothetical protein